MSRSSLDFVRHIYDEFQFLLEQSELTTYEQFL